MTDTQLNFTEDFPRPSYDEWVAEVEKALKGAPFDKKMLNKSYEGFTIRPIYTRQDWPADGDPSGFPGAMPFTRGGRAAGNRVDNWDVRQFYADAEPKICNEEILNELERGVTSLELRFDQAGRAGLDADAADAEALVGRDGVAMYTVDDLDMVLTGVELDLVPISVQAGPQFLPAAALLSGLWERRGVSGDKAQGEFNADPISTLAASGSLPCALDTALAQMADLAAYTAKTYPRVRAVGVDSSPYNGAGANEAQDLAISMATAVAYLRAMASAGMDIDTACRQMMFTYSLGCDQFLGICKLRAARKLWSRVAEACGASEEARAMRIHAKTAERIMTQRDPWVNMLRTTVMCFSAAAGGADTITVLPYNAMLGLPDTLARRVARNTQIILAEESNVAKVVDPGGGSWYIETRTDELARAAWAEFQEIEKGGGIIGVLKDGSLAGKIAASYAEREKNLARRKEALTGVNEFPNIHEKLPELRKPDLTDCRKGATDRLKAGRDANTGAAGAVKSLADADAGAKAEAAVAAAKAGVTIGAMAKVLAGDAVSLEPLPERRIASAFEALRDASDAYKEKHGAFPKIFLANLGPIARHTARATFAKNFFEVGGIEAVTNTGFKDAEACAAAFKDSGARIAIICSADPIYEEMVPTLAPALKEAGCDYLFLAGAPGDKKDAYKQAGVDDFVFMGGDVLGTLRSTLSRLGVI
ncbi:MAG: methylmalonyl-CoA mutase small subunit [Rhodospirillales bacterium]|nr:methylmalonyl-CoA mutase small subunit [Rhodospirillales bacterium]